MATQGTPDQSRTVITFFSQEEAENAYDMLRREADFSDDQLTIQPEAVSPNQFLEETQVKRSVGGGIVTGAVLGGGIGFLIGAANQSFPDITSATLHLNPLLTTLLGVIIGAFAMGLVGAAAGVNVPKTQKKEGKPEDSSYKYNLTIQGTQHDDILRAAEVLRQHGVQI